ncbi:MAG: TlpA disulfide reductase family protein [Myxococcota bacterium]
MLQQAAKGMRVRAWAGMVALLMGTAEVAAAASNNVHDVIFKDTAGREVTLRQFHGKVLVIHVFATWDMQGLRGVQELSALQQQRKDVQVVGVAVDGLQETRAFVNVFKPAYPVWTTAPAFTEGRTPFGLTREVPRVFVVGADGTLRGGYAGYVPFAELEKLVEGAGARRKR